MLTKDRRQGRRLPIARPAKLRCLQSGKYMVGRTQNVSTSGALLEVDRPSLLISGQRLAVGIAWRPGQALLHGNQLIQATVVRCLALGLTQHVAVKFDTPQTIDLHPYDHQTSADIETTYGAAL